jgi:Ala-tRNA(Pro) deacylase
VGYPEGRKAKERRPAVPVAKLIDYLDENGVKYVVLRHSQAFTAQEVAAAAHVPGGELAKTVMVKLDGKMAMAVVPASRHVVFERLQEASGAGEVELAGEDEFQALFPSCELGAVPPFGNLWEMPVWMDESLSDDPEIAFSAGTHTELVRLSREDYERLVRPEVAAFAAKT